MKLNGYSHANTIVVGVFFVNFNFMVLWEGSVVHFQRRLKIRIQLVLILILLLRDRVFEREGVFVGDTFVDWVAVFF